MNKNSLRAEIVRNGMTQAQVAKSIGVSESTFIRKMKNGSFSLSEAKCLIELLHIKDPGSIFFGDN